MAEVGTMIDPEVAERRRRRVAIHLKRGNFEACHNIIDDAQAKNQQESDNGECTTLVDLPAGCSYHTWLRTVSQLEKAGYIYISDLNGVDIMALRLPQLGLRSLITIKQALEEHEEREKKKKEKADALCINPT